MPTLKAWFQSLQPVSRAMVVTHGVITMVFLARGGLEILTHLGWVEGSALHGLSSEPLTTRLLVVFLVYLTLSLFPILYAFIGRLLPIIGVALYGMYVALLVGLAIL
ncbi:hypothetical protein [Magnetococcus sp. PR-3]|uniref:hypothetical protein n=1 Tax=Magnetococcus sp. PR-3 TaxID=3120355 RepID=UPI002FCE4CCD